MKRTTLVMIAIGLATLPFLMGQLTTTRVQPSILACPKSPWAELGTITASNAYPAVTARSYTSVTALPDANTIVWVPEDWARKAQLTFQTNADADSTTVVIIGFSDAKTYTQAGYQNITDQGIYCGTLVLTGGTQTGTHSNVFVDTIAATNGVLDFTVLDSATNRIAVVEFSTKGFKRFVFIATTLQASSTLYAQARLF